MQLSPLSLQTRKLGREQELAQGHTVGKPPREWNPAWTHPVLPPLQAISRTWPDHSLILWGWGILNLRSQVTGLGKMAWIAGRGYWDSQFGKEVTLRAASQSPKGTEESLSSQLCLPRFIFNKTGESWSSWSSQGWWLIFGPRPRGLDCMRTVL